MTVEGMTHHTPDIPTSSKVVAEFVGTFLLVFTVGCNVLTGSGTWAATSIAAILMVSIYALGGVSGANFNPAVSLALGLSKKLDWANVGIYCVTQIIGGVAAGFAYTTMFSGVVNVGPAPGFGWWEAMLAEILYTFVLCFVVLNAACSKKSGCATGQQYYGMAIGFVIVAGGYGAGSISGGAFNPAVALGLDCSSIGSGFKGWSFAYVVYEFIGATIAAALFRVVRPDDFEVGTMYEAGSHGVPAHGTSDYALHVKCVSEFLGTYVLVLTVGLNVLGGSPAGAWSIAASLMCMIYALGTVSGAHFNPAVTVAIMCSGRGKCHLKDGAAYIPCQILGGVAAAYTYAGMHHGKTFDLGPVAPYGWTSALVGEAVFTFVLCFVVLSVATVETPLSQFFGLAIGSCVTAGGLAIGGVSGGSLNPAVSTAISSAAIIGGGKFYACLIYSAVEILGALAAAGVFFVTHPGEFATKEETKPLTQKKKAGEP